MFYCEMSFLFYHSNTLKLVFFCTTWKEYLMHWLSSYDDSVLTLQYSPLWKGAHTLFHMMSAGRAKWCFFSSPISLETVGKAPQPNGKVFWNKKSGAGKQQWRHGSCKDVCVTFNIEVPRKKEWDQWELAERRAKDPGETCSNSLWAGDESTPSIGPLLPRKIQDCPEGAVLTLHL